MRSQVPTGYQSPFGSQNYRSQPSQPTFNNYSYQQPGQFGGQIMNQSIRSPGGKGGYQPSMQQQMPSPGGKGRSYQRQQIPSGYGQSTFNPGQFGGYGRPSNMFSSSSPHYQPYMPPVYETPPLYRGDDPRGSGSGVTSSPPSTGSKGGTQRPMPDYFSSGVSGNQGGYQPSFGAKGGSQPSFGGKGGYYQSAEQPSQTGEPVQQPVQQPPEVNVSTPPPLGNNPPPRLDYEFTPPKDKPISAPLPCFSGINQDSNADFYTGMPKPFMPEVIPDAPAPFMPEVIHDAPIGFGSKYSKAPAAPVTTQPPAPVNNQTLTPVMPKPTPPSSEAPVFGSVDGIGGDQLVGIGSLIGPSGLPEQPRSFTPPRNPLHILLEERGFQVPESHQGLAKTADHAMHGIDPVTGRMRFGSGSDTEYYKKLDEMYAQNPEALEIAKQYHADQLKKQSAQKGLAPALLPATKANPSPKPLVPQRFMTMGPESFGNPLGRLR